MNADIIESMHERARAIHRALTGDEVPDASDGDGTPETEDVVMQRFAELEVMARSVPAVAECIAPFTFSPPLDVAALDDAVLFELDLPGVDRDDLAVELVGDALVISGIRRSERRTFHAEIARGPFVRSIPLGAPVCEPRWELERGVLRVFVTLPAEEQPTTPAVDPTT